MAIFPYKAFIGVAQKFGNRKYPHRNFFQYLEAGAIQEDARDMCCRMLGLQLLRETYQVFVKLPPVHSTSWKFSLAFIHIFRVDWMLLNKFGSSNPSFSRSILKLLSLQAQIAVIH